MPPHPRPAPSARDIRGSVFSGLAHRLEALTGEVYPLHVGDTWMEPPEGCRMEDLVISEHPGMHRYAPPPGLPALLDAIVERMRARLEVAVERAHVLVTAGATGGLTAAVGALVSPGEEVIVLAPHWPLIEGIVRALHGVPVIVPFLGVAEDVASAVATVERARSARTVALYLSTPNNPTGRVLPPDWVAALVGWARRHDLWVLSDEVYEDYVYAGEHAYAHALAPERTVSVHSFSKAFGMAGNRCGFIVGPAGALGEIRKVAVHTVYSAPTAAQLAGLRALGGAGDAWVARARQQYAALGRDAAAALGVDPPEGGTFLFVDVAARLDERGLGGFLEDCVAAGVFVAPGPSFGPYSTHVRACFTAAEPDVVRRGFATLARLLDVP